MIVEVLFELITFLSNSMDVCVEVLLIEVYHGALSWVDGISDFNHKRVISGKLFQLIQGECRLLIFLHLTKYDR
jgi:hypothetical protein